MSKDTDCMTMQYDCKFNETDLDKEFTLIRYVVIDLPETSEEEEDSREETVTEQRSGRTRQRPDYYGERATCY